MEGTVIGGRFAIEARAGAGGMGVVYRALDRSTNERVAVKVLNDPSAAGTIRFVQEAAVLDALEHPGIVRYVAHGTTDDGRQFLALEWLDGEDLSARIARAPLPVEEVLAIGTQAALALAAAHARGVIHRDVKPSNLFLVGGDPRRVKLLDFGIARREVSATDSTAAPLTRTGAIVGTVGYMAPEQARGDRAVDARADVFALGCVLHESLTGQPAFAGGNVVAVLAKILLEDPPRLRALRDDVPVELDEVVARMLAKDRFVRPPDASAVAAALGCVSLEPSPREPPSPSLGEREQRVITVALVRTTDVSATTAIVARFGGDVIPLAEGTLLLTFDRAPDQVARAAACALALAAARPLEIALATGRVDTTLEARLGPILERVASLLDRPSEGARITLDAVSAGLLESRFDVRSIGGRFVLRDSLHERTEPRLLLGRSTPFVGRDKELALLEATFRECADELVARAVLATGPAGAGKSRLAHELVARLPAEAQVLVARADPVGSGSALALIRELVRRAARSGLDAHVEKLFPPDQRAPLRDLLGELIGAPSAEPGPQLRAARNDASVMSASLQYAFEEWLGAHTSRAPTQLVLEDLQWADAASIAQVASAIRVHAQRPLMVLALGRPELHRLGPEQWQNAGAQELRLPALTRSASERLVRGALPDASDEQIARLVARADGNPFYLEELARHVVEHGDDRIPETVLAIVEARIDHLDPEARRVLRVASVFGERFPERGVEALTEPDRTRETDRTAALRRLIERELVVGAPGSGQYAFRHSLLRDAAYATLTDVDRRACHRLAGEWLSRNGEDDAFVLADHFERAGETTLALPHLARAARKAAGASNLADAASLGARGIALGASGEIRAQLMNARAIAAAGAGELHDAVKCSKEALALLPRGSVDWFFALAVMLQAGVRTNDFDLVPVALAELVSLESDPDPSGPYGFAVYMLVDILDTVDQGEVSRSILEQAERVADTNADSDPMFVSMIAMSRAAFDSRRDADIGRTRMAIDRAQAAQALLPKGVRRIWPDFLDALFDAEAGQFDRAIRRLESIAARFERDGATLFASWARLQRGWALYGVEHYDEVLASARALFDSPDARHARALAAAALLGLGRLDEADELSAEAMRAMDDELVTPWVALLARVMRGRVLLERGRAVEALALTQLPTSDAARIPTPWSLLLLLRLEAARAAGDLALARRTAEEARARLERHARSLPDPARRETFLAVRWNVRTLAIARETLA
ncbi:MAG: protein kinase [Labilithrix sp.]